MNAIARPLPTAARIGLGLIYFVFGLNFFLGFIPQPEHTPEMMAFIGGLFGTGYFFPMLKAVEILGGALLLSNRFVPLAQLLLAPITVNIAVSHLFLEPAGAAVGIVLVAGQLILAWAYRDVFRTVLVAKVEPARPEPAVDRVPVVA